MRNEMTGLHYPGDLPKGADGMWEIFYRLKQHDQLADDHRKAVTQAVRRGWFPLYWMAWASLSNHLQDHRVLETWPYGDDGANPANPLFGEEEANAE